MCGCPELMYQRLATPARNLEGNPLPVAIHQADSRMRPDKILEAIARLEQVGVIEPERKRVAFALDRGRRPLEPLFRLGLLLVRLVMTASRIQPRVLLLQPLAEVVAETSP